MRHGAKEAEFRERIQHAKDRRQLSDIIGRVTKLAKRGPRELVGLCPFHSERSPSFEVNDSKGFYHCHGCGRSGDAIRFLTEKHGLSFIDALRDLEDGTYPEVTEADRAKRRQEEAALTAQRIADAQAIWARAVPAPGTPAEVYARARGITTPLPDTARFVMTPRWRNPETGEVGRDTPAMACALQDRGGTVVGVQCIFLQDGGRRKYERIRQDGTKAKAKLSFGIIVGSAFVAGGQYPPSPGRDPIICEGPEDGLTLAQELPGETVLVACGTALMPRIDLVPSITGVVLAGDNNAAGRVAVDEATASFIERGLSVRPIWPDPAFKDWNDQLRGVRA
ncbi:CHC2 zinc finger domain-containing protein [Sphingomonas sp. 1P06PA]|uniref:CHC2 zinc finger domain-containing protein n=1 Tax=Sphingomonas sp. 1P06PA TaxID=554121 RepID=UPI0039A433C5